MPITDILITLALAATLGVGGAILLRLRRLRLDGSAVRAAVVELDAAVVRAHEAAVALRAAAAEADRAGARLSSERAGDRRALGELSDMVDVAKMVADRLEAQAAAALARRRKRARPASPAVLDGGEQPNVVRLPRRRS